MEARAIGAMARWTQPTRSTITGGFCASWVTSPPTTSPRGADEIDRQGNLLNEDGTVTLHRSMRENLKALAQADLMGFTLPRQYGGLNCPNLIYTMANEIVSRGDASLMNLFGLQGIADTINAFADQPVKDAVPAALCTRGADGRDGADGTRRGVGPASGVVAGVAG